MKDSLGLKVETLLAKASILLISSGNWSFFTRDCFCCNIKFSGIHILNVDGNTAPNPTSTNQMNFVPCWSLLYCIETHNMVSQNFKISGRRKKTIATTYVDSSKIFILRHNWLTIYLKQEILHSLFLVVSF